MRRAPLDCSSVHVARNGHSICTGTVCETTCNCNGGEHRHTAVIFVLPGIPNFAENIEWPERLDLDADAGILDQTLSESVGEGMLKFPHRHPPNRHRPDKG